MEDYSQAKAMDDNERYGPAGKAQGKGGEGKEGKRRDEGEEQQKGGAGWEDSRKGSDLLNSKKITQQPDEPVEPNSTPSTLLPQPPLSFWEDGEHGLGTLGRRCFSRTRVARRV